MRQTNESGKERKKERKKKGKKSLIGIMKSAIIIIYSFHIERLKFL